MPVPDRLPPAIAALSDRDLEILGMLTAGHTVKSIAVRLGRSEASINERLRDARRKSGIGSSRELARLVDAHSGVAHNETTQKIWDEKIDLSTPDAATDDAVPSANTGRFGSKGTIIMYATMLGAAAGLFIMNADAVDQAASEQTLHAAPSRQAPLAGSWSLDVARIPESERPRRVTIMFRVSAEHRWTTRVEIVGPDGSSREAESTAALDGVPVPVSGNMDFIDTVSLRQPAPNTLVMTLGKNGAPVSTRVYTVAKDGKTMTETIVWAGTTIPKLETTYFNRIG